MSPDDEMTRNCINGDDKQLIEYIEICKIINKKAREDTGKYNQNFIRETMKGSKSLRKERRR